MTTTTEDPEVRAQLDALTRELRDAERLLEEHLRICPGAAALDEVPR